MSEETFKAGAEAIKASAELGSKAIDAGTSFGALFKGAISERVGMLEDRWKAQRWKQRVKLVIDAHKYLKDRGLSGATRDIPMPFAVNLLQNGELEESDDLRDIWSRLLANAADAGSGIEPRVAYVEILAEMTSLDAQNLEVLVRAQLRHQGKTETALIVTGKLPNTAEPFDEPKDYDLLPEVRVAVSVSNLARLGLVEPASATFGGKPLYHYVVITPLGLDFYHSCSRTPLTNE